MAEKNIPVEDRKRTTEEAAPKSDAVIMGGLSERKTPGRLQTENFKPAPSGPVRSGGDN